VSYLEADYRQRCGEANHIIFSFLGVVFLVAYVIFIPAAFLFKLNTFRTTILGKKASHSYRPAVGKKGEKGYKKQHGHAAIAGNHHYIELSPYKPIFMFYHPEAYRFEIYFWVEKGFLLVVSQLLGMLLNDTTGIFQWFINMLVAICFLVLVSYYQPSIESRFNVGNVMVHAGIVYVYMCSLLLNPRLALEGSFIEQAGGHLFIDLSLVFSQLALGGYFIWTSVWGWTDLWKQSRAHVRTQLWFEGSVPDHVEYYEEMQRHFPAGVAMILTKMHHHEDLHSYHIHANETWHDRRKAKKMLKEYKKDVKTNKTDKKTQNPLHKHDAEDLDPSDPREDADPSDTPAETRAQKKARQRLEKEQAKKAEAGGISVANPLMEAGDSDDEDNGEDNGAAAMTKLGLNQVGTFPRLESESQNAE